MSDPIVPVEAERYLSRKQLKPSFDWRDTMRQEHDINFVVAKMTELDLLQTVHEAVVNAVADGETFKSFAQRLTPHLVEKGWWGKRVMRDPLDGSDKLVQLGSDARLKRIYETNMRTAYAAGQWERMQRTKAVLPYLLYELGPSKEHRKEHLGWKGLLLPVDHPFWKTHFPPNGWGCKCRVRQVSAQEAQKLIESGSITTEAPSTEYRDWTNPRTGEVERVPKGIDPGWDYTPGASLHAKTSGLLSKAAAMEPSLASSIVTQALKRPAVSAALEAQFASEVARIAVDMAKGVARPRGTVWTLGALPVEVIATLKTLDIAPQSAVIAMGDNDLMHMLRDAKGKRKQADGTAADKRLPLDWLKALPTHLQQPQAIVQDLQQAAPTLLFVYDLGDKAGKVVLKLDYLVKTKEGKVKLNMVRSGELLTNPQQLNDRTNYKLIWEEK